MPVPEGWDAKAAIEACPVATWEGRVWRMHKRRYAATNPGGARKVSGRYNRGLDRFPEAESFPALYLATSPEVCLGEVNRHVTPKLFSRRSMTIASASTLCGWRPSSIASRMRLDFAISQLTDIRMSPRVKLERTEAV